MLAKVYSSGIQGIDAYPVEVEVDLARGLLRTAKFLDHELSIEPYKYDLKKALKESSSYEVDFSEVKGQLHVKRALEIAAAGSRNIFMLWSQYDLPV